MPFPASPRVIYKKNPLDEVICQLKFPPILRIDSEVPAKFQESVRRDYPLLQEVSPAFQNILGRGLPAEVSKLVNFEIPFSVAGKVYHFISADEKWKVGLAKEFIALSTGSYKRWEEFSARLEYVFSSLLSEYSPSFFVRIGLRYRDVIRRSVLDLGEIRWSELLKPHILGELASTDIESEILHTSRETLIAISGSKARVHIRHGLAKIADSNEEVYLIDSDFYYEDRTEVKNVITRLDSLHQEAGHLFRWYITDKLHHALQPEAI
jgi:uncharacterized protein (TIGR04255 family)